MSAEYRTEFDQQHGINSITETLGDAGVTQIFVHCITALGDRVELDATLPGFTKYAERALLMARPDDLVCVLDKVDNRYLQFLSHLGVGPQGGNVIVAAKPVQPYIDECPLDALVNNSEALVTIRRLVRQDTKIILNPYFMSAKMFELATALQAVLSREVSVLGGDLHIVDYANHKHNVRTKALELGVPVPEGEVVEIALQAGGLPNLTLLWIAINRYIHRTGRVIIKGSHGFSGSSIAIIEDSSQRAEKALSEVAGRMKKKIYLVEVMLDVTVSPNILMYIEPGQGRVSCVGVTDQILNGDLKHEGNIYPSGARTLQDMLNSARQMAHWLQAQGYWGLAGFDFGEYFNRETGQFAHFLAEVNPRINGAAYPKALVEHLNRGQRQKNKPCIGAFLAADITTPAKSFAELARLSGHLFFDPKTGKGLVPYNVGCLENGRCSVALLGQSRSEVIRMYENLQALFVSEHTLSDGDSGKERNVL